LFSPISLYAIGSPGFRAITVSAAIIASANCPRARRRTARAYSALIWSDRRERDAVVVALDEDVAAAEPVATAVERGDRRSVMIEFCMTRRWREMDSNF
jgi:hypothetical protein